MKRRMKISLIIASVFCLVGVLLFGIAFAMAGFDIKLLSNEKYELNVHDVELTFDGIEIESSVSDITFTLSKDNTCRVMCHEREKVSHEVLVENGKLIIREIDTRRWYEHINFFSFPDESITVSLPQAQYASLLIELSTGDVHIPAEIAFGEIKIDSSTGNVNVYGMGARTDSLTVTLSTGDINLKDILCARISLTTTTGEITLRNTVAEERLEIRTSTGDVDLEGVDAPDIAIRTSTGDVEGRLLSPKQFLVDTRTGDVALPPSEGTEICHIKTSTGDIEIDIKK